MKKVISVAICVMFLSACVPVSNYEESRVVVTKTRPLSETEKLIIQESVKAKLKDPDSAIFRLPPVNENGAPDSYCGLVNAKNSYGGYTGFTPFAATLMRMDGEIKDSSSILPAASRHGIRAMYSMCEKNGYLFQ
ncbi:hypothetical protein Bresa_01098|uniref:hypothetical protein n=1 Tax=Brenneria salicis TaxID=55214 RepID=UPI0011BE10FF|nr:hypothetical protein [Brenneria salicis]NMN90981.1 hypothetical protein [Brenneria salicis ATCC 15712 = DSM 30166]